MTKSLKILNAKVALRTFEIAAIAAQLTSYLSQEPLLAALRGLFLPTGESFLLALDILITGFERDWTELRVLAPNVGLEPTTLRLEESHALLTERQNSFLCSCLYSIL